MQQRCDDENLEVETRVGGGYDERRPVDTVEKLLDVPEDLNHMVAEDVGHLGLELSLERVKEGNPLGGGGVDRRPIVS